MTFAHAAAASREAAPPILWPDLVRGGAAPLPAGAPGQRPGPHDPCDPCDPCDPYGSLVLPAGVWRAEDWVAAEEAVLSTGEPALDAVLPGGGWPLGALTELLQPQPHAHIWRLLAPALAQALARQPGPVVLVAPPRAPFAPGLAALGLPAERWLWVDADTGAGTSAHPNTRSNTRASAKSAAAARLWATEQALRCADVAAVLAWLPQAEVADLRRLQLSAQRHRQLLFVMRPLAARTQASPARLRLMVEEGETSSAQAQAHSARGTTSPLRVQVLKRRGPPLVSPLLLPAQPPLLGRLLRARRRDIGVGAPESLRAAALTAGVPAGMPAASDAASGASFFTSARPATRHGLDRAPSRA